MNKLSILVSSIKKDFNKYSSPIYINSFQRFFKHPVKCYGVKSADVRSISKKYWKDIKELDKKEIFLLCEELLKTDYSEDAFLVFSWIPNFKNNFIENDIKIFEKWIDKYINNWAKCDGFCCGAVCLYLEKYPAKIEELKRWAVSKNIWMKRASAVSLVPLARKGEYLEEVFKISKILLIDTNDMVQKGYGWLLKEASRKHEKEVFDFVLRNKDKMPRTALRYAIELMPKNLKTIAMSKSQ